MRVIKKLPSFANVSAGSTASLSLPVGLTYERLILEFSGVTLAQMKSIKVNINGKTIHEYADGAEIKLLNDYYARADNTGSGFLSIWFTRPEPVKLSQQRMFGIGTADIATFDLQIDLDAGAEGPVLAAHAIVSAPTNLGLIYKIKRFPKSAATSGDFEIDSIPKPPGHQIMACHFLKADVDRLEIDRDSLRIYEADKDLGEILQEEAGRVPQTASATHYEPVMHGDMMEGLPVTGVQDLRFRANLGTSGSVVQVVEYSGPLAGI